MSRTVLIMTIFAVCAIDARFRRQIDDDYDEEESDMAVSGWDPTIRDRFKNCHSLASFAPTSEEYCEAFTMCCSMQFDPNNGDKCQTNEQRCEPHEEGRGAYAVCIQRNCTELVTTTTTTTTTTTPAPSIVKTTANTAGSMFFAGTTLLSLWLLQ